MIKGFDYLCTKNKKVMKDIKYFLDAEDRYNQANQETVLLWNNGLESIEHDPLSFLRKRPFHRSYDSIGYVREQTIGYELNDAEHTVLSMFIMQCSQYFRDDYYYKPIPEIATSMFEVLESVVAKAPRFDNKTLYRFCNDYDKSCIKVDDVILVPHNLTCTADRWNRNDCNIYVIQTLSQDKTRAHDLCKMYPHNHAEKQVNFLRGTKFLVTDIKEIRGTVFHEFYLRELEKND